MSKARILIVDDEEDICSSLRLYMEASEYEVSCASNGVEALCVLEEKKIDLIISDIVMPKMTGVDLLKEVRDHYPMVRVIMITGYVTLENALACMRHGADSCMFKPLNNLDELLAEVEKSLAIVNNWKMKLSDLVAMKPDSLGGFHG